MSKKKILFISGMSLFITILLTILHIHSINISALRQESPQNNSIVSTDTDSNSRLYIALHQDLESGPVVTVPWEHDQSFLKAQAQNNVFIQMAAYHTVLPDPLPGEEYNVHLAAKMLAGSVINPGEVFSQNEKLGPYTQKRGYKIGPTYLGPQLSTTVGGGVCKIASTLYNVAILSNLEIIERYPHSMPVPYVPYGQDATVSYGMKDLKFKNTTGSPILIWAQGVNNSLYIAFYGRTKPPKVEWHHKILHITKKKRLYRNNITLPNGRETVVLKGMDGALLDSWLTITDNEGSRIIRPLGKTYYYPMPEIIERGGNPALSRTTPDTN